MIYIHYLKIEHHTKFILGLEIFGNDSMMPSQLTHVKSNYPGYEDKTLQLAQLFYSTVILNIVFGIFAINIFAIDIFEAAFLLHS